LYDAWSGKYEDPNSKPPWNVTVEKWREAAFAFEWMLTAKATSSGKTHYKLTAVEQL